MEGPFLSHPDRIEGLGRASVDPTARLFVRAMSPEATGKIILGNGAYLGRQVELMAPEFGLLSIGDDTSIQDFCVIHGHVSIGAHCLVSMNIMIGSTIHRFRDHPTWLIRDQDTDVLRTVGAGPDKWSRPIAIEDDCWFGWNVAVMPGVYVGRGAVIGANCVLTKDVGPYEIHGGIPNKLIGSRIQFQPPSSVDALDDDAIPYFYRGFDLRQSSLVLTRKRGIAEAKGSACIVLAENAGGALRLSGTRTDGPEHLRLRVRVNGLEHGIHSIDSDQFTFTISIRDKSPEARPANPAPNVLKNCTYIELDEVDEGGAGSVVGSKGGRYGISAASLLR